MLEEILINYQGTLIIVSHDRDFLDQTVTKILAFEGNAVVEQHIGGYSDYLENKKKQNAPKLSKPKDKIKTEKPVAPIAADEKEAKTTPVKLTYKDQRALDLLPKEIAKLESRIAGLETKLAAPDFYQENPDDFHATVKELETIKGRLAEKEDLWLELEEKSMG